MIRKIDVTTGAMVKDFLHQGKKMRSADGMLDVAAEIEAKTLSPADILQKLTESLYYTHYAGFNGADFRNIHADSNFTKMLSVASTTKEYSDYGWIVDTLMGSGQIMARKNEDKLTLTKYEYTPLSATVAPGSPVVRNFIKGTDAVQSHYYYIFADQVFQQAGGMVRLYWNTDGHGMPVLVNAISTTLNTYCVPFLFKCLSSPALYGRRDAAVLYLHKKHAKVVNHLLPGIYNTVKDHMNDSIPGFTKRIAAGLGYAEGPASGDSFGIDRCRIVARGLISGLFANASKHAQYADIIAGQFQRVHIDPLKPYLSNNALDVIKPIQ